MEHSAFPHVNSSLPPISVSIAPKKDLRHWLNLHVAPTGLAVLLGLTGGWLGQAIAPSAAHAYTSTVNVTIDVQPSETYDTLVRRAEAIARAATQRSFDRDILVTDVSIVIIAQGASATVPVLSLTTTRPQWRSQPDPRRWATYYSTAKALLRLNSTPSATTASPTVTTAAPAAIQPSPQPRATAPGTPTAPADSPVGGTGSSQSSPTAPTPILPQRIPTPGNIGK